MNPNHLAGFLVALLPMAMAQVFVGRGKAVSKVLYGYAALMMAGGDCGVDVAGWMGLRHGRADGSVRLAGMASAGTPVAGDAGGYRFRRGRILFLMRSDKARSRIENVSTDGTMDSCRSPRALETRPCPCGGSPLVGCGSRAVRCGFPATASRGFQSSPVRVHNEYLNLLVDYGVAGALAAGLV